MERHEDILGFFDREGTEGDRYRTIDDFLGLSKRFSVGALKRKRMIGVLAGSAMALLGIVLCFMSSEALSGGIMIIILGVCVALFGVLVFKRGNIPQLERTKEIIACDGIDAVFEDFLAARYLSGSPVMMGSRYLFVEGEAMARIENIKRVYYHKNSGRNASAYIMAEVFDDSGTQPVMLENVTHLPSNTRKEKVGMYTAAIMHAQMTAEKTNSPTRSGTE